MPDLPDARSWSDELRSQIRDTTAAWPLTPERLLANALTNGHARIVDAEPARGGVKLLIVEITESRS